MTITDRRRFKMLSSFYGEVPVLQTHEIIPRLYIADMYTATDPLMLRSIGITHIVSVIDTESSDFPSNVKLLWLPMKDEATTGICYVLDNTIEWIKGWGVQPLGRQGGHMLAWT
jgi:hypothetical protein